MREDLSVIAKSAGLGNITEASLKKSLAQFRKFVNSLREENKISYSDRSEKKAPLTPTFYSYMGKVVDDIKMVKMGAGYLGVVEAASSSLVTQTKKEIRKNLLFSLFFVQNRPFSRILRPKSSPKRFHNLTT